jgi:hypothetical protein
VTIVGAFIFFTDTHVRSWRIVGGTFHAFLHLAAAFAVGWLALRFTTGALELHYGSILQLLISGAITFLLGGPVGAFILGVYLFTSIRFFGRHSTEAFSSLRIQDFKQWLRLKIDAAGNLTIYAIALDRVPRRWRTAVRAGAETLVPDDTRATPAKLVDSVEVRG